MKKNTTQISHNLNLLLGRSGGALRLNATGTYSEKDGDTLGTFNGQPVYVKVVNSHLNAYTYDSAGGPLQFKPGHWILAAGLLDQASAENFSQTDPATGYFHTPPSGFSGSTLGKAASGGSTTPPPSGGGGGGGGTTPPPTNGNNLINNLLGTTKTGTGETPQSNILVVVLIIAAVGGLVYYFAKKK